MTRASTLAVLLILGAGCDGGRSADAQPAAPPSAWSSAQACVAALATRTPRATGRLRIGTWNIRWFPDGAAGDPHAERSTDVPWLGCAIASLDVDVLAVQEIVQHPRGRSAILALLEELERHTGHRWQARFDDCPDDGRQHLGFLFDTEAVTVATRHLPDLHPSGGGCDGRLRPGLGAFVRARTGVDLHLVTLHLDSGTGERDHRNRRASIDRLSGVLEALRPLGLDRDLVVLGDLNTMGCARCEPPVDAAQELAALDAQLARTTPPMLRVPAALPCSEYHRGRGASLDHVLVRRGLEELPASARVEVHGPCAELRCGRSRGHAALDRLSDHCPLVLELDGADLDDAAVSGTAPAP